MLSYRAALMTAMFKKIALARENWVWDGTNMIFSAFFTATVLAASSHSAWDIAQIKKDPSKTHSDAVVLRNGTKLDLGFFLPKDGYLVGKLENQSGPPAYLFKGMPCVECDADPMLEIYSVISKKAEESIFPGKISAQNDILDENPPVLKFNVHVYFGHCLKAHQRSVVVIEKSKNDTGVWAEAARTVDLVEDGRLNSVPITDFQSATDEIAKSIKSGQCREVAGLDRIIF